MISLCIRLGLVREAISYAERGKSRTLVEMIHSAQLQPSDEVPEGVRRSFLAVRAKLEELRARSEAGESEAGRDFTIGAEGEGGNLFRSFPVTDASPREKITQLVSEVQAAYNRLLEQVRESDPQFAAAERVQPLSVSEMETLIPEGTVFVECFAAGDACYVFVLDGKTPLSDAHLVLRDLRASELLNSLALKKWLLPYYTYLEDRSPQNCDAWFEAIEKVPRMLAETLWFAEDENGRSLASLIEKSGARRIVFLPHSGLHLLPLHLIPISGNGSTKRVMDRFEIAYAPSISMLRFTLGRERRSLDSLFAASNPNFDNPDLRLAFTDDEVRAIAAHFPDPVVLRHEQATREDVLDRAGRAGAVHFSCHGNFHFADPMRSRLILAGGDTDESKNLNLRDIFSKLRLPRAAVVVLSACETGMVKLESGDEYIGLPSGFLYAGAASVISSLWSVDDLSTSLLMQRWYENVLQKKMGKAAALREAQLWVRDVTIDEIRPHLERTMKEAKKEANPEERKIMRLKVLLDCPDHDLPFEHPFYWGAFICTGNWN